MREGVSREEVIMNLLELRDYIQQTKIASLGHLCARFQRDSDVIRQMLCHWTRKGCIRRVSKTPACGTACHQCSVVVTEIYEWAV